MAGALADGLGIDVVADGNCGGDGVVWEWPRGAGCTVHKAPSGRAFQVLAARIFFIIRSAWLNSGADIAVAKTWERVQPCTHLLVIWNFTHNGAATGEIGRAHV